jgi:hypothetical protein
MADGKHTMRLTRRRADERGVALVEMAVVLPLLIVLALGVAEAAWAFSQQNAVRSMVREGARIAATNAGASPDIAVLICDGLEIENVAQAEATGYGAFTRGGRAFFRMEMAYTPLTGFFSAFTGATIIESVDFNVELENEPAWWSPTGGDATCVPS